MVDDDKLPPHRLIGLVAGPLVFTALLALPAPAGLSADGWTTATVGAWMALWWMTEATALAVTALLPLILFPLLGIRGLDETAQAYANPLIFLFLGGFLLARAMRVWTLDRRLALAVLGLAGAHPARVVGGIMAVTAFLSMWVSNTATAMVMLPIGLSVVALFAEQKDAKLPPALLLGIAYAATIGGMGTIIGTPPNALFVGFMAESYGIEIGFAQWMLVGVPLVCVLLPLAWLVLTRVCFRLGDDAAPAVAAAIATQRAGLAPISRAEVMVAVLMVLVAVCWLFRPLLNAFVPLSDAGIAMTGAALLFVLPADLKRGRFLLHWDEAMTIRWDVLILFGGGLALAGAIGASDLAGWIGERLAGFDALPAWALLLALGILIVLVGELASNTAMAAVFLPVAGAAALAMGEPAVTLTLPIALFATLGFMLPVATPPNAVIFGSGAVKMGHMLRAGAILDAVGIVVVAIGVLTLGRWVLG
ncbi:MAG: DASS family sodium-coupled anion symporter [Alphaproteobacteria bacterium]